MWFWPEKGCSPSEMGRAVARGNDATGAGAVIDASVINVEKMPRFAFGHRSVLWWATLGLFAIEGTAFALVITSYLYIKGRNPHWAPGVFPPISSGAR